MKLQHLSVIFIIIIIPILIVLEQYMHLEIKTITKQTEYSSKLSDATYDAVKAFQANTINNKYSSVADSKIRDVQASISTFKTSLSSIFESQTGVIEKDIDIFIPAILFNLYDGYYIYGKYDDYHTDDNAIEKTNHDTGYGIRPFIYYACRYKKSGVDVVINYTLDNRITINGTTNSNTYVNESGYLINTAGMIQPNLNYHDSVLYNKSELVNSLQINIGNNTYIKPELTKERIVIVNDTYDPQDNTGDKDTEFYYTIYKGNKYYISNETDAIEADYDKYRTTRAEKHYYDKDGYEKTEQEYIDNPKYFYYRNNKKNAVSIGQYEVLNHLTGLTTFKNDLNRDVVYNDADVMYYNEAYYFSKKIQDDTYLKSLEQSNAVEKDGSSINAETYFSTVLNGSFLETSDTNNPLSDKSLFYNVKYNVIRKSIETNLSTAIANFAANGDFYMPKIGEEEWEQIAHNVSVTAFMQGIPIGAKMFNDYQIVSNNVNKEVVLNNSIYIVDNTKKEAHSPGCSKFLNNSIIVDNNNNNNYNNNGSFVGYSNTSFERQSISDGNEDRLHYYPHSQQKCYSCIVNTIEDFDENYLISGTDEDYEKINGEATLTPQQKDNLRRLRTVYLSALGREKYTLDQLYK